MSKKVETIISITGLLIAIITLVFGDNIYYQVTGKSFAKDFNNFFSRKIVPTPTQTAAATVVPKSSLYDDFNKRIEDDGIDYSRWDVYNEYGKSCIFSQTQGHLEINHSASSSMAGCFLNKISNEPIGDKLETWEMKVKVASNFQGDCCGFVGLTLSSNSFSNGGGWVECNLDPDPINNVAVFRLVHNNGYVEEYRRTRSTTFDVWHSLRLAIDHAKFEFSCYIDDSLIGSVVPKDEGRLRNASFSQYIQMGWPPNTTGTYYIDDVLIHP